MTSPSRAGGLPFFGVCGIGGRTLGPSLVAASVPMSPKGSTVSVSGITVCSSGSKSWGVPVAIGSTLTVVSVAFCSFSCSFCSSSAVFFRLLALRRTLENFTPPATAPPKRLPSANDAKISLASTSSPITRFPATSPRASSVPSMAAAIPALVGTATTGLSPCPTLKALPSTRPPTISVIAVARDDFDALDKDSFTWGIFIKASRMDAPSAKFTPFLAINSLNFASLLMMA